MSLQIVQNQQLKPIGDKVPIDTTLSSSSENAISNKAVNDEITRINNDLSEWVDITNDCAWNANVSTRFAAYNPATKCVVIKAIGSSLASGATVVTLPENYRVSVDTLNYSAGYYTSSNNRFPLASNHQSNGNVQVSYATGITADIHLQSTFIVGTQITI